MTTAAPGSLGSALQVEVRASVAGSCASFTGTVLVAAGTTLNGAAFGSNAQGFQAGDRTLAGGASETLCFRATLPLSASTTLQGASTTATFTFDAEQTVNNP
jgi:hypothetical protein